jgi:hypothetical protein
MALYFIARTMCRIMKVRSDPFYSSPPQLEHELNSESNVDPTGDEPLGRSTVDSLMSKPKILHMGMRRGGSTINQIS